MNGAESLVEWVGEAVDQEDYDWRIIAAVAILTTNPKLAHEFSVLIKERASNAARVIRMILDD